jgi:DNA-binding NtrC family response regulator
MTRDAPTRRRKVGADAGAPPPTPPTTAPAALRLHRRGRPPGTVHLDALASWSIGRGAAVDLCFDDDGVSRLHAHVKHEDGAFVLVDARSANGTFVVDGTDRDGDADVDRDDGRRALFARARLVVPGEPLVLGVGDVVFFGDAFAALEVVAAPATATTTTTPTTRTTTTTSEAGRRFAAALERAARARGPVLLIGPSGSGKTWAARRIHDASERAGRFLALNAAALPEDPVQLRSVLLGHKKGAFTGATHDVEGAWNAADGGTLFLDEIDSLAPGGQAFLLTLLEQSGDLGALGDVAGARTPRRDVRVIAASKTSLTGAHLRPDLAWRLVDGTIVELPTLDERRADLPALVDALLVELAGEDGAAASFSRGALNAVVEAAWPGQMRQLRGVVRVLAREALAEGRAVVDAHDVRARVDALARALGPAGSPAPLPTTTPAPTTTTTTAPDAPPATATATTTTTTTMASAPRKKPRALTVDDVRAALEAEGGNIARAAERLGVVRNTLIAKMDAFGLPRPGRPVDDDGS